MRRNRAKTLALLSFCSIFYIIDEVACKVVLPRDVEAADFRNVRHSRWFVDKTMLINDIFQSESYLRLLTYPRGWGKTTNMHMLELYFTHLDASKNSKLFEDTHISQCAHCKQVQALQGKLPVIFLDFAEIEPGFTERDLLRSMQSLVAKAYSRYVYLREAFEKRYGANSNELREFNNYCDGTFSGYSRYTEEINRENERIREEEKRIREMEKLIREKEKPYRKLHESLTQEVAEVKNMKNISAAEKNERLKEIYSFYARFDELRPHNSSSGDLQKTLKRMQSDRDELKTSELLSLRDHVFESVKFLAMLLKREIGRPIVIIDEYDAPITTSVFNVGREGALAYILETLASFLYATFHSKTVSPGRCGECPIYVGFITGTLCMGAHTVFSHVHISYTSVENDPLYLHYGFTQKEVEALIRESKTNGSLTKGELKHWYGGYKKPEDFSQEFYCPRSVVNALRFKKTGNYFTKNLAGIDALIQNEYVRPTIENLIKKGTDALYVESLALDRFTLDRFTSLTNAKVIEPGATPLLNLLFATGYLTLVTSRYGYDGKAANREVRAELSRLLVSAHTAEFGIGREQLDRASTALENVFASGDVTDFQMHFQKLLKAYPPMLHFNESICLRVIDLLGFNLLSKDESDFDFGELTDRKSNDNKKMGLVFYRRDIGVGSAIKVKAKGSAADAVQLAEKEYSEHLDGFDGIRKKIFIGVNVGKDKTVQMNLVKRDVVGIKSAHAFNASRPK